MSISSINSNLAALLAQINIGTATQNTSNDVAALSSGNRIVSASTDVAALAAGTALTSQVNTLNASLSVASQGSSLLQVADGSLAQIQSILQRQQAIATSAQSGSLSSTQRGFLDQEFQALTSEIDQLASSTNFNGVNLIDGSLSGANPLQSTTADVTTATAAPAVILQGTGGDATSGFTIGLTAAYGIVDSGSTSTSPTSGETSTASTVIDTHLSGDLSKGVFTVTDLGGGTSAQITGYNVSYAINGVTYTGTIAATAGVVAGSTALSLTSVTSNTATINFTTGSVGPLSTDLGTNSADDAAIQSALTAVFATASRVSPNSAAVISGTTPNTIVTGASFTNDLGQADTTFSGNLSAGTFNTSGNAGGPYAISYSLNGSIYQGTLSSSLETSGGTLILDNGKGSIALTIAAGTATSASAVNTALTNFFAGATAYAKRTVITSDASNATTNAVIDNSSIAANATNGTDNTAGTLLAGFTGADVTVQSSQFSGANLPTISGFTATSGAGGALASLSVTIDGQIYTTKTVSTASPTTISTTQFGTDTAGVINFYENGNTSSNNVLTLNLKPSVLTTDATNIGTAQGTTNFLDALNQVFGGNGGGLSFQVGSSSSDTIGVTIGSAASATLFGNVKQDVLTQDDAITAGTTVQNALNTVTALRATVGADEERFNFASSAIQSASQNEGAAQSNLLDTDVASTSTTFATNQVQLQAGIAVLAQANQLQQNLLKLIQ